MRIVTLKLLDGNLCFEHSVTLEAARIYWRTWTPRRDGCTCAQGAMTCDHCVVDYQRVWG